MSNEVQTCLFCSKPLINRFHGTEYCNNVCWQRYNYKPKRKVGRPTKEERMEQAAKELAEEDKKHSRAHLDVFMGTEGYEGEIL